MLDIQRALLVTPSHWNPSVIMTPETHVNAFWTPSLSQPSRGNTWEDRLWVRPLVLINKRIDQSSERAKALFFLNSGHPCSPCVFYACVAVAFRYDKRVYWQAVCDGLFVLRVSSQSAAYMCSLASCGLLQGLGDRPERAFR